MKQIEIPGPPVKSCVHVWWLASHWCGRDETEEPVTGAVVICNNCKGLTLLEWEQWDALSPLNRVLELPVYILSITD